MEAFIDTAGKDQSDPLILTQLNSTKAIRDSIQINFGECGLAACLGSLQGWCLLGVHRKPSYSFQTASWMLAFWVVIYRCLWALFICSEICKSDNEALRDPSFPWRSPESVGCYHHGEEHWENPSFIQSAGCEWWVDHFLYTWSKKVVLVLVLFLE